jgi:hypothetical protein
MKKVSLTFDAHEPATIEFIQKAEPELELLNLNVEEDLSTTTEETTVSSSTESVLIDEESEEKASTTPEVIEPLLDEPTHTQAGPVQGQEPPVVSEVEPEPVPEDEPIVEENDTDEETEVDEKEVETEEEEVTPVPEIDVDDE